MNDSESNGKMIGFGIGGLFAGGLIGFLLRPSAFLAGQLSFAQVISRGSDFAGLDQVLVPLAQESFNIMFGLAVVGAIAGLLLGKYISEK